MNSRVFEQARKDENLCFFQDKYQRWWFVEKIHSGWGQALEVDEFLHYQKTSFQTIAVFKNDKLGNVMLLDGAVQIAENDWRPYQEMLVCSTLLPEHNNPEVAKEILIVGGGDGGVATIMLEFFPKSKVTMVEIDAGVIEVSKKFLPAISKSLSVQNENFKLLIGDGVKFVADEKNHGKYDAVIVDCTDPSDEGPALGLFGRSFQENVKMCLKPQGIVLQQSGCLAFQAEQVREMAEMMKEIYPSAVIQRVEMLTYPGTMMLIGGSAHRFYKQTLVERQAKYSINYGNHGLALKAKYVTPDILINSFNLPAQFVESLLGYSLTNSLNRSSAISSLNLHAQKRKLDQVSRPAKLTK